MESIVKNYKKLLLIKPPLSPDEEYGDLSILGSCEPPMGLCCIAAYAKKFDIETSILDCIALRLSYEEAADIAAKDSSDIIGFTAETPTILSSARLAGMIKAVTPYKTILIGGTHISALPEKTMKRCKEFDIGIIGEGEATLVELINALKTKKELSNIKGIILRKKDNLLLTKDRGLIPSLDSLPLPAWGLLPRLSTHYRLSLYSINHNPSLSIVSSRGCAFKCRFCFQGVFHGRVRRYSPSYIVHMVRTLKERYGIRELRFQDDNFIAHKEGIMAFCSILKKEGVAISWSCLARCDHIDMDTLKVMKEAGCWQILLGIESGCQQILDRIDKKISLEDIRNGVRCINSIKMRSVGYFIIGFPWDNKNTIMETIRFARSIPLDDIRINYFVPFPGTPIHAASDKKDKIEWSSMNFFTGPCYAPDGMTKDEIVYLRKTAYISFYIRAAVIISYIKRVLCRPILGFKYIKGVLIILTYLLLGSPKKKDIKG